MRQKVMVFILIGMPGCGKSCMGKAVSRKLGLRHVDSDRIIERRYGKKLSELIEELGVDEFKRIEKETLLSMKLDNVVFSTGGSAVYYPEAMEHLKSFGAVVYLYCSYDIIAERIGDFSRRGVVMNEGQTLRELYDERAELYKRYADVTVDCSGRDYSKYRSRVFSVMKYMMETQ